MINNQEISLRNITHKNLEEIVTLNINEEDKQFVDSNAYSIAEAYTEPNTHPRGIYLGSTPIGFTLYGKWIGEKNYWIARLMIDSSYRRKGYAFKAMQLVVEDLSKFDDCKAIYISFVPENIYAKKLYEKLGFKNTGKIVDDEILYELKI